MNLDDHLGKLAALGSADQIRDFFVNEKITGECSESTTCPVANYLRRETGRWYSVNPHATRRIEHLERVDNPAVITEFVHRFDLGQYPELEEPHDLSL